MGNAGLKPFFMHEHLQASLSGVTLSFVSDFSLFGVNYRPENLPALAERFEGELPDVARANAWQVGVMLWLAPGHMMTIAFSDHPNEGDLADIVGTDAWVTDLTDGWVCLAVAGPKASQRFQEISPVNLNPKQAPDGTVASTVIEHLRVVIWKRSDEDFLVLSAASSAQSLFHSFEHLLAHR